VPLLISCLGKDTGGGLFSYDGVAPEQIDTLSTTGIAQAGERFGRLLWSSGETGSVGELLVYDEIGVRSYSRIDSLREPHDLFWDGSSFVSVSTMTNSLVWHSPTGEVEREWRAPGDGDAWHLNGVTEIGDRLLACAFGRFSRHREWEGRTNGTGIVFDPATGEDVLGGLSCPHDPRLVDELWLVCNSARRELVAIDPPGDVRRRAQLRGWTRGLAIDADFIYVGESANRNDLGNKLASVAVLDRRTWKVIDRLALPCREVFDLELVEPTLVDGIRRGFRTNSLRVSEQDQHALFAAAGVQPARLWAIGEPLAPSARRAHIEASVPKELAAATIHECSCTVENAGGAILVSAPPNPVHIAYRWLPQGDNSRAVEGDRSILPEALPPRAVLTCNFSLKTPAEPGEYTLIVTLVQEQVGWFDENGESVWTGLVDVV
jgi:Domain of unknown function (DUF4915)